MKRILAIVAVLLCCAQQAGAVELFSRSVYYHCGRPYYSYHAYKAAAAVVPNYNQNSVTYNYTLNYSQPAAVQGQSQYGLTELGQFYGDVDFGEVLNQASRLAEGSQQLSLKATSGFQDLVATTHGDRSRVAEIIAKGQAASQALGAIKASNSATIVRQGGGVVSNEPVAPAASGLGTIEAKCARCHNAAAAKALGNDNVLPAFAEFTAEQADAALDYITRLDASNNCAVKAQLSHAEQQELRRFLCKKTN